MKKIIIIIAVGFISGCQIHVGYRYQEKESTLTSYPLKTETGAFIPQYSGARGSFSELHRDSETGEYFITQGVNAPERGYPDSPYAAVWQVIPTAECAVLRPYNLEAFRKRENMQHMFRDLASLPDSGCFSSYDKGGCLSKDGRLRISNEFDGSISRKPVLNVGHTWGGQRGLFAEQTFLSGKYILKVEEIASGQKIVFTQRLFNAASYKDVDASNVAYLPEMNLVLFSGLVMDQDPNELRCVKLSH